MKSSISRFWWVGLICLILFPVLSFFGAAVVTYLQPEKFESSVRIQVLRSSVEIHGFSMRGTPQRKIGVKPSDMDLSKVLDEEVIRAAVVELDLSRRWGLSEDQVVAIVFAISTVEKEPDADILTITVRYKNAEDTRDIAQALAEQLALSRKQKEQARAKMELSLLDSELREQKVRVEEKLKVLEQMMKETDQSALEKGDLYRAQSVYKVEFSLLEELRIEHSTKRISLKLPRDLVEIQEKAKLSNKPVSPNVPLNLLIGAAIGLVLGILGFVLAPLLCGAIFRQKAS